MNLGKGISTLANLLLISEISVSRGTFLNCRRDRNPKGRYPYALIIKTKLCPDGLVRSCTVETSDGLIRERDVRKLVLLEEAGQSYFTQDKV